MSDGRNGTRDLSAFYNLFGPKTVFLPIIGGTKKPLHDSWQSTTFEQTQTPQYQKELQTGNLSVLLGPASDNLISVDFDDDLYYSLYGRDNPDLLETTQTCGAKGRNLWYHVEGKYPTCVCKFDSTRQMGEWRGGGGHTLIDGVHPNSTPDHKILYREVFPDEHLQPKTVRFKDFRWPGGFKIPAEPDEFDSKIEFPCWLDNSSLVESAASKPPDLIAGLLGEGQKMLLGGGSKSYKTWGLSELAICLSCGLPWLGHNCRAVRVLYINFELFDYTHSERILNIARARGALMRKENLWRWPLRGFAQPIETICDEIVRRLITDPVGFDAVIWDPTYKTYGDRDENKAGDMTQIMNAADRLATEIKAAQIMAAHFSKGNQSAREAIDRIGGSGVFGRDPDTIITMTKLDEKEAEEAFSLDFILRAHERIDPLAVRWEYPVFVLDPNLDPSKIKKPHSGGRSPAHEPEEIVELLSQYDDQFDTKSWQKKAYDELGISRATFYRYKKSLEKDGEIFVSKASGFWNVARNRDAKSNA